MQHENCLRLGLACVIIKAFMIVPDKKGW